MTIETLVEDIFENLRSIIPEEQNLLRKIDGTYEKLILSTIQEIPSDVLQTMEELIRGMSAILQFIDLENVIATIDSDSFPALSKTMKDLITPNGKPIKTLIIVNKYITKLLPADTPTLTKRSIEMVVRRMSNLFDIVDYIITKPHLIKKFILEKYAKMPSLFP